MPKMTDLSSQKPPQSTPKWHQIHTKKQPKIDTKNEAKKEPKKDELNTLQTTKSIEKPMEKQ